MLEIVSEDKSELRKHKTAFGMYMYFLSTLSTASEEVGHMNYS